MTGPARHERKLFTSEARRQQRLAERQGDATAVDPTGVTNADLLRELRALREELRRREGGDAGTGGGAAPAGQPDPRAQREAEEAALLRNELHALSRAIQETKAEIAALRPPNTDEDRLLIVTNELDEVVKATERATEGILGAAERIDELANSIRLAASDEQERNLADEVMERTVTIFEACNFQDLTGQRITKVVNTLQFVEQRIMAMIEIWGSDDLAELAPETQAEDGEAALLNGPQAEDQAISQDDIDKLFD